ncbi:MAG: outer membrane lipoprotein carrier protein LolA [Betaproteobacteria bacterium]|nr:outer membrane lipoprotein carrier protein LolA [Betaproteobacteria bacterium]
MPRCLLLVIILAMCPSCLGVSGARAEEHDPQALLLLQEAARHSANIATLSADFQQEKKLGILAQPLTSQGYMCVTRVADPSGGQASPAPSSAHRERLLWAYTSPAPSGFVYENGQGALWEAQPSNKRTAGPQEARVITAIVRHILDWVRIDAEALQQAYRLERPDKELPVLLLYPRRQSFFTRLEAVFAPALDSVRQLTFFEPNGDTVSIMFTDTQINRPLPARCFQ